MTSAFLSLNTPILASSLPLHADTVHYLVYEGNHTVVWDIRRKIVEEEEEVNHTEILKSTLWTVQVVSQNIHRLWLFYIGNHNSKPLQDQRLVKVFESTMILRCLYPCSEECSFQNAPCPNCNSPEFPSVYTAAKCLPRRPWRRPWNAFRDAVRAALIRSVNHNITDQDQNPKRWASALKNGFIVADAILKPNSDEWVTSGWEQTRTLLYVHIQIVPALESSPRLIVHPAVLRTPYCILGKTPTAGTALTLLPYGTPAYFMANYSGPTSTLTAQFRDVLRGLAVDGWEGPNYPKKNGKGKGRGEARNPVNYVIVFIPVNIDGSADRKGLTVIYPSLLALAIPPGVRAPMDISLLPTLPAPLQPSPTVPAAVVSVTPSAPVNGALNSPLTGPRSAYQFPPGPPIPSATANAFPTLNSPLVFGSGVNHNQLPQAHTSPLYSQGAGNVVHVGAAGSGAPGPGTPFPLSNITSSTLASSLIAGNPSQVSTGSEARRNPSLSINSNDMLLRAHRVVSTASRLSALASPSSVNTPVAIPTPGVPTPGTVSVTTPGGPSTAPFATSVLIPGSTTSTLHQTAAEVSAYVEYVAREREKERERLKEAQAQRGRMVSYSSISNNGASTTVNSSTNSVSRSVPPISIPPSIPPTMTNHTMHSGSDAQLFYPSPPTNPPSVSAAGIAMSPAPYQDTAAFPQIPQGLPSMHDTNIGSSRISPSELGENSDVNEIVQGIMDVSALENSRGGTQRPLAETDISAAGTENTISSTRPPLEATESTPIPASEPEIQPVSTANPDPSWSYFGGDGVDFDGLGTMSGVNSMTGNGMTADDMDMSLFGVGGGGTFNFDNLNDFGDGGMDWNMDSTFDLGSNSTSTFKQFTDSGTGDSGARAYAMGTQSTDSSFHSFQSANVYGQPMAPPMTRAVTAPTQTSVSSTQQLSGSGAGSNLGIGMDFEADFTDDDFSFFDNKSSTVSHTVGPSSDPLIMPPPSSASAPPVLHASNSTAPSPDPLAFLNSDDSSSFFSSLGLAPPLPLASTPTPGPYGYHSHPTPFSMSQLTPGGPTGFTPLTADVEVDMDPGLPSPPEEADYLNIDVQLDQTTLSSPIRHSSVRTPLGKPASTSPPAPSSPVKDKKFSPIPFAKSHHQADSKYRIAGGKFVLSRKSSGWLYKNHRPYSTPSANQVTEVGQGKWWLPSPPVDSDITDSSVDESDGDEPLTVLSSTEHPSLTSSSDAPLPQPTRFTDMSTSSSSHKAMSRASWRPRYDRATDPRIGVIRRLAGCKQKSRKRIKKDDWAGASNKHIQPKWLKDWEDDTGRHSNDDSDFQSHDESEEEEEEEEEEAVAATLEEPDDVYTTRKYGRRERSRPTTPLPAYLPLGPSLISTCFHWVHLASMAGGDDVSRNTISEGSVHELPQIPNHLYRGVGITHGVPTPVSPVALVGTSNSASPAFATTPGTTWPQALTPSADADFISEEEKAWMLEATVNSVAQECVENLLWSDTWNSMDELMGNSGHSALHSESSSRKIGTSKTTNWSMNKSMDRVWPSDIRIVKDLLAEAKVLGDHILSIGDLFEGCSPTPTPILTPKMTSSTHSIQPAFSAISTTSHSSILSPLSPPLLSVAKSEAIIHVMPSALRFWDKVGLGPKGGKKNITVFVIYEQRYHETEAEQHDGTGNAHGWRSERIMSWLRNMCELYKAKNLGEMLPGKSNLCQNDGLVSFRFDSSFQKSLASFIASLPPPEDSPAFFILTPLSVMSLSSETLCHVFSAVNKTLKSYSEAQPLFQFVPEPHVLNAAVHSSSLHDFRSGSFLHSVYDRILMPSERAMSRKFFTYGQKEKKYFEVPAFTLARSLSETKVSYSCSTEPALDVLDRHILLHVGYGISSCGRWILASCIDQRGETHAMGVWSTQRRTPSDNERKDDMPGMDATMVLDELYTVNKVWNFAMQFAEKARVEWRIVFAKSGNMSVAELDAWITHSYSALHSNSQIPMHISILNVENSVPWTLTPASQTQSLGITNQHPTSRGSSLSRSVPNSMKVSSKSQFFVDTTATTYELCQKDRLPVGIPPTLDDIGLSSDLVDVSLPIENDDYSLADDQPLLPLSSSTLICVPDSSVLPRMVNIHLIYAAKSEGCAYPTATSDAADSPQSLLRDITSSYYSLSVLSSARWETVSSLPFHLGAVETMRKALSTRNCLESLRRDT